MKRRSRTKLLRLILDNRILIADLVALGEGCHCLAEPQSTRQHHRVKAGRATPSQKSHVYRVFSSAIKQQAIDLHETFCRDAGGCNKPTEACYSNEIVRIKYFEFSLAELQHQLVRYMDVMR